MSSDWRPTRIENVWRRTLDVHPDDRGSFMELWRASWLDGLPGMRPGATMRQSNVSRSAPRVLRGLHMHQRQSDLWVVVDGHPLVALVDVRPTLSRSGAPVADTFDAAPGEAVFIPDGVAHGFYARDAITLVYLVTNEYDGSDELGFAWKDPDAGVPWPDPSPILSGRDAQAPTLAELLAGLPIKG
jgi:dTDP-4-dehydrorhamnose 3,5-epimerase